MKIWKLVFFLTLAAVAPSSAFAADEIHWTITGQTSVTFDWRGAEDTLFYGTSPGNYTNQVVGIQPSPLPTSSSGPFREARIAGLQENTLYYYAIGTGPEHTFRTPPLRGNANFTVFAEGDINASNSRLRVAGVQEVIANGLPNFVLAVGDLTYGEDDVTRVDQHFNDVMVWSQDAAYMPAWGNHDWDTSTSKPDQLNNYEGRFDFPNSQTSPGASAAIGNGPGEDWYWFDYGNVRFIAYPEPYSGAWSDWNTQVQALMDATQADSSITYIVTYGHRPAYTSGHHTPDSTLKGILDALGDSHSKYVLNVNGHSHNYERSFPQHGVVHVTVGTGGGNLEQDGDCLWRVCTQPAWSAFRAMHHGALKLRFTANAIQGEFICGPAGDTGSNKNDVICNPGEVVDAFSIGTVSGDTTPPTVVITEPAPTATVSGTVPVSANASDDSGQVAGVQFKLDGNNLNAEDKTDPYSISWDTITTTNGAHTLSAGVRDAAGNTASDSITVTVSNPIPTVTFAPAADATIMSGSPTTNFGSAAILEADNSPVDQFLMKFTVSGLAGQQVQSAKLRLYNVNPSEKGGDFYRVADSGWIESTVTWNSAPASDTTAFASLGAVSANTWYEVDVTPLITGEGTFSLRVETTLSDGADYNSKETSEFAPQLMVTLQQ